MAWSGCLAQDTSRIMILRSVQPRIRDYGTDPAIHLMSPSLPTELVHLQGPSAYAYRGNPFAEASSLHLSDAPSRNICPRPYCLLQTRRILFISSSRIKIDKVLYISA